MNRRIEIIFDASYSMGEKIGRKTKLDIAKEIFNDEILPQIKNEPNVYLRVLPFDCNSTSDCILLSKNQNDRVQEINKIQLKGTTPLYKTIKKSIDSAINQSVDELKLIILSDGGDNCSSMVNEIIDWSKIKDSNLLGSIIIELGEIGAVGRNSLQSLAQKLNAQRAFVGNNGRISKKEIKKIIQKGLKNANIVAGKLTHCYDKKLQGEDYTWEKLNDLFSISKFHAQFLFKRNLLSFDPYKYDILNAHHVKEIEFLFKIVFKSNIDIETVSNMLHNLEYPYYYDHDCIRWNFDMAMWVPIIKQEINEIKISDFTKQEILQQVSINDFPKDDILTRVNPNDFEVSDLIKALKSKKFLSENEKNKIQKIIGPTSNFRQVFSNENLYRVKRLEQMTNESMDKLPPEEFELELCTNPNQDFKHLYDGDIISFRR